MADEPESIGSKLERAFDVPLGWLTKMMAANPRKVAIGILVLIGILLLGMLSR